MFVYLRTVLVAASACLAQNSAYKCSNSDVAFPSIPGTHQASIETNIVRDYQVQASDAQTGVSEEVTFTFCNVTVEYGHQDWDDRVKVHIWLPLDDWNGRLSGIGGGGFASISGFEAHAWAVARGYAAVGTDAGVAMNGQDPSSWALDEAGKVDFIRLQNFFTISQYEASIIGKHVVKNVYGEGPHHSYWNGCSTGGRQGLMLAQRYPNAYDGILAGAPAINWATFVPAMYYPQFLMNQAQHYPPMCVFDHANNAVVKACDELDGMKDGIITNPDSCNFSAAALVGKAFNCNNDTMLFGEQEADLVQAIWDGPKWEDGTSIWFGLPKGTPFRALAATTCNDTTCYGVPFGITANWIGLFVQQNLSYDLTTLPSDGFASVIARSFAAYDSVASTNNPDLHEFKATGGKIIQWHGTADTLIYEPGSIHYYDRVEARDPGVRGYYRYFRAPGAAHCEIGDGFAPSESLEQLVDWVENGVAPDILTSTRKNGETRSLQPYPLAPMQDE